MKLEILAYEETPLGILCLRRRELLTRPGTMVTEVTLNHEFLMSSYLTASERALASLGLQRISAIDNGGKPLSALVGGLGLGYTAFETLASERVGKVEVVEFLPEVIGWLNADLVPLASALVADNRLLVTNGDIYERLMETGNQDDRFDLIVIDVDHSPEDVLGSQSEGFYSITGLNHVFSHLNPGGVFGLWSYAEDSPLLANMQNVFCDVAVEKVTVWNDLIDVEQTDWLFFGNRPTV